jgi:hypothetical protein
MGARLSFFIASHTWFRFLGLLHPAVVYRFKMKSSKRNEAQCKTSFKLE